MTDQPSTSDHDNEPPRGRSITADFIWDPELQAWYAPGEPSMWDAEAWLREFQEEMNNRSDEERRQGLISVDQLRAAGALDVPASWRKSLAPERSRYRSLFADDDQDATKQDRTELDTDEESSADEEVSAGDEASADEAE